MTYLLDPQQKRVNQFQHKRADRSPQEQLNQWIENLNFNYPQKFVQTQNDIVEFSRKAFEDKYGSHWYALTRMLYQLNLNLIENGYGIGTDRAYAEWIVRNTIEKTQQEYLQPEEIPEHILAEPLACIDWLKAEGRKHRANHHPLFDWFEDDSLTTEELRIFLSNYKVNMERFHLHIAAYSLIVPFETRKALYDNLYDEFGQGDFSQAHPNLFKPLMEALGGFHEEDVNVESYACLNEKITLCWFSDGPVYCLGAMGILETTIPQQLGQPLALMRKRGYSEDILKFLSVHCEGDEEHGDAWFEAGLPFLQTPEDCRKMIAGGMRMLEARAIVYDGILKKIKQMRQIAS
jgi:pyrroloquinoline quinone (PQQ) biosynthesis protein C